MHCTSVPYGSGTVRTAHGLLPVPAPATLKLMLGLPTRPGPPNASGELCTPTGVALLRSLAPDLALSWTSGRPPLGFTPTHVGLGAGSKNFPGHPNVVRAVIGHVPNGSCGGASVRKGAVLAAAASGGSTTTLPKATSGQPSGTVDHGHTRTTHGGAGPGHDYAASTSSSRSSNAAAALGAGVGVGTTSGAVLSEEGSGSAENKSHDWDTSTLFVVEANLDDTPAENLAYAVQRLLDAGALDAWTSVCF